MSRSKSGRHVGRQLAFLVVCTLLLPVIIFPETTRAADLDLSSKTYLHLYQRDIPGGKTSDFAPLYEYLSADAVNIGGAPFSFHFYGWGRVDLGDETSSERTTGELGSAYLQYLHPTGNGEMRLGRFFLTEGAAMETLDGVFLKARTSVGLGMSVFGGVPAETTITATKTGDSIYGGRLFYARPGVAELGVSYLQEKGNFQGKDRKEVGGDLWLRPVGMIELIGRTTYNESTRAFAFQRYLARLMPIASVNLAVGYETYKYKDLFQTALQPAFLFPAIDNSDQVRVLFAVLDWEAVKNVTVSLGGKNIKHDRKDPGDANRGELGVKYVFNNLKDAAGLSAALVDADREENSYQEYRAFATYSPAKWRFSLDALTQRYKQAISGVKDAYSAVGSAGYKLFDNFQLSGDLTYTKSPRFQEDYAGLIRATLSYGTGTGGKK